MTPEFECGATAGVLDSGRTLAGISHTAAVIAAIGLMLSHSILVQAMMTGSIGCWVAGCYFAVRVAIDAGLFRQLAAHPDEGDAALDEWLRRLRTLNGHAERSITERSNGSLRLWRRQVALLVMQIVVLAAGLLLHVAGA